MSRYETIGTTMRYHDRLKVKRACGHEGSFSQAEAVQVFGPDATPYDIRKLLRCSACKKTGLVEVWV